MKKFRKLLTFPKSMYLIGFDRKNSHSYLIWAENGKNVTIDLLIVHKIYRISSRTSMKTESVHITQNIMDREGEWIF